MNGQQFEAGVLLARVGLSKAQKVAGELLEAFEDIWEMEEIRLNIEYINSQLDAIPYSIMRSKKEEERVALRQTEIDLKARRTKLETRASELTAKVGARRASQAQKVRG